MCGGGRGVVGRMHPLSWSHTRPPTLYPMLQLEYAVIPNRHWPLNLSSPKQYIGFVLTGGHMGQVGRLRPNFMLGCWLLVLANLSHTMALY
jgi:hypothetical protein